METINFNEYGEIVNLEPVVNEPTRREYLVEDNWEGVNVRLLLRSSWDEETHRWDTSPLFASSEDCLAAWKVLGYRVRDMLDGICRTIIARGGQSVSAGCY